MHIETILKQIIADELGTTPQEISGDLPFDEMQLDSLSVVSITYALEQKISTELDPTIFTECKTINQLAVWLQQQHLNPPQ